MRIAEINDIASVASEIGAGLRARGHEVTLFHPRLVGAGLHPQIKPITAPIRALDWIDLIRRIRAGNFDLVHIHYAYLGNIGALGGFPYILHCHGTDLRGETAVTRPLIRRALAEARHVFYSTPDLEAYVARVRDDGEFLPNPIDTVQFRPIVPAGERPGVFICCGLTEVKGAGRLLARCRQLFFTSKQQGSGIGLALCQQIAESSGGSLDIKSTLGDGTVVTLEVPLHPARLSRPGSG